MRRHRGGRERMRNREVLTVALAGQWQACHRFSPAQANRLLLVLSIVYAFAVSLGTLALAASVLACYLFDKQRTTFRYGLRLGASGLTRPGGPFAFLAQAAFVSLDAFCLKTVAPSTPAGEGQESG